MRLRKMSDAYLYLDNSSYVIKNPKDYFGRWNKVFGNDNPIHIEIGSGKGKFIIDNAIKYPNINFIAIEKYDTVIVSAIKKLKDKDLPNLRIICMDAKELDTVFNKEIDVLYLNFSDPWPKTRHHKRRLTSHEYLKIYDTIFKSDKHIEQKTDNDILYAYSIESLSTYGYTLKNITFDITLSKYNVNNITTEYEEKFIKQGKNIYYLTAIMTSDK